MHLNPVQAKEFVTQFVQRNSIVDDFQNDLMKEIYDKYYICNKKIPTQSIMHFYKDPQHNEKNDCIDVSYHADDHVHTMCLLMDNFKFAEPMELPTTKQPKLKRKTTFKLPKTSTKKPLTPPPKNCNLCGKTMQYVYIPCDCGRIHDLFK